MDLSTLLSKWKAFVADLNTHGIPLPLVRDPKTGFGSVTLTMSFISFNIMAVGLMGKYAKMLDGVDLGQALQLFIACMSFYLGRRIIKDQNGKITADPNEEKE